MDGEGMTGLNPGQAKQNIENFYSSAMHAGEELSNAFSDLLLNLSNSWASPKAMIFGESCDAQGSDLLNNYYTAIYSIAKNAEHAYNVIASAHGGEGYISVNISNEGHVESLGGRSFKAEKDGVVGMNIALVKVDLDAFDISMNKFYSSLDSIPMEIAFYDTEGTQLASYRNAIAKCKNDAKTAAESVRKEVQAAMETEQNTILLAKQQATETLNG